MIYLYYPNSGHKCGSVKNDKNSGKTVWQNWGQPHVMCFGSVVESIDEFVTGTRVIMDSGQTIHTFWKCGQILGPQSNWLVPSIEQFNPVEANVKFIAPRGEEANLEND